MKNELSEVSTCEVCGNKNLKSVLDLGPHPMCDDLVPVGDLRVCREYPIEIMYCELCRTAHQRFQIPKQELFPASYHYRSRFTADVLNGMQDLVAACEHRFGSLAGKRVFDIGCNDGSLLDFFRQKGAETIGVEPTDAFRDAEQKGHLIFNNYFNQGVAAEVVDRVGRPDLITFTNVFAHIENLRDVLDSLKYLLAPQTVMVIENHYLGSVLDRNQFDTFYHEHPRTYSFTSFTHIARSLEISVLDVEFPSRYGGNIRVFMGNPQATGTMSAARIDELDKREAKFSDRFGRLSHNVVKWREIKKRFILDQVQRYGKLRAKAFPGRAAILVKLLGLNDELISAVYEKPGSMKIGYYVPGTHIPIRSDDELFKLPDQSSPMLNLAWHIQLEIRNYLEKQGYTGPIFDIIGLDDFSH